MIEQYQGDFIVTREQYEQLLDMATTGKMIDLLNEIYSNNVNRAKCGVINVDETAWKSESDFNGTVRR